MLDSVQLENGNDEYPEGDSVQVAVPWNPPDAWDGITNDVTNKILTVIREGIIDEDGNKALYSDTVKSKDRWAGHVIRSETKDGDEYTKSEADAKKILKKWMQEDGFLRITEYQDERQRKERKGLEVVSYAGDVTS